MGGCSGVSFFFVVIIDLRVGSEESFPTAEDVLALARECGFSIGADHLQ
jgi:hypothetical protein